MGPGRPRGGSTRASRARAESQDDGRLARVLLRGARQLEATGQHRIDDDGVPLEVQEEELAAPADGGEPLADECFQLGRRAADRERRDRGRGADRPASEGGMERLGDDRQVGEFGHGRPIVADCSCQKACARLSRPSGPPTAEERRASQIAHEGADRGVDHHGPLDRIGDGLSVARAVRDSGAKSMTGAPIS